MAALVDNVIRSKLTDQLTERSLKFYDGTYKWNSDGFEDEDGVYRQFNDDDPLCRPPTPNPPESLSDDESAGHSSESPVRELSLSPLQRKLTDSNSYSSPPVPINHSRFHSVVKRPIPEITLLPTTRALLQDNASGAATHMAGHKKTLLRDDLFLDKEHAVQERLKGRLEGILIGKWYEEAGLTIEESYEQVGIPFPDDIVKAALLSAAIRQGTRVVPVETKDMVIRSGGQKGPSETADPFPDLFSDLSSELSDPPSEMEDATGAGPEADPVSGRKEACSTPVNAKESDLSRPARIDLLGRSGRSRGKRGIGGDGGSDEDDDDGEDKDRKKGPKDDHESAKPRRKKKKDDDEEDDDDKEGDGGNDGGGGDKNGDSKNTEGSNTNHKESTGDTTESAADEMNEEEESTIIEEESNTVAKGKGKRGVKTTKETESPAKKRKMTPDGGTLTPARVTKIYARKNSAKKTPPKKTPTKKRDTPTEEKKTPVEEKKTPVGEKKTPVDEKKTPVKVKKPPKEKETPAPRKSARLASIAEQ